MGEGESSFKITKSIEYKLNTGYSEQFFYTGIDGSLTDLNSILFFKPIDSEEWQYEEEFALITWNGSDEIILEQVYGNFLEKFESSSVIETFLSCNYNEKYNTIDDAVIEKDLI